MDGDPVTGEPSVDNDTNAPCETSLAEAFYQLCPSYMAIGMTYDEFWNCNTKTHKAYREAWEQKRHNKNWEMWRQGAYVYDALLKASPVLRASFGKGKSPEPEEYPKEPYPLTEKEAREREEATRKLNFKRLLAMLNKESENAIKEEQEARKDG